MQASGWRFLSVLSIGTALVGVPACGDDDDSVAADRADGGDGGGGTDARGDGGASAETAPPIDAAADAAVAVDAAPSEYVLDLSQVVPPGAAMPGDLVLAAGDMVVFPIDVVARSRPITALGPGTLEKMATGASCAGLAEPTQRAAVLAALEPAARPGGMSVRLTGVRVDLPHQASQEATPRVPTTLCFGYRVQSGAWLFPAGGLHASVVEGTMSSFIQVMPSGTLPPVDAVAILVDAPSVVRQIRFYTPGAGL